MTITDSTNTSRRLAMVAFLVLIVGLPVWVWYCLIAVVHFDGALVLPGAAFWSHVSPPSLEGAAFYLAWLGLQAALYRFLPGRLEKGQPLPDGSRLTYRLNGLAS